MWRAGVLAAPRHKHRGEENQSDLPAHCQACPLQCLPIAIEQACKPTVMHTVVSCKGGHTNTAGSGGASSEPAAAPSRPLPMHMRKHV